MVEVDGRGCGTPSGDCFVYVFRNNQWWFQGGYTTEQIANVLFVLRNKYGFSNVRVSKGKMLNIGNKPHASKESTASAIKRVTEFEKSVNNTFYRRREI